MFARESDTGDVGGLQALEREVNFLLLVRLHVRACINVYLYFVLKHLQAVCAGHAPGMNKLICVPAYLCLLVLWWFCNVWIICSARGQYLCVSEDERASEKHELCVRPCVCGGKLRRCVTTYRASVTMSVSVIGICGTIIMIPREIPRVLSPGE